MDYKEISFKIDNASLEMEILMAQLAEIGFDSFMESDDGFLAYIPCSDFYETQLIELVDSSQSKLEYSLKTIKDQNWNEVWESNYDPVNIKDQVYIRAPFHNTNPDVKYEIVVDPKMSFGTAHHETTSLMMELMLDEDITGKKVLDMGCGTGILAIFSELKGATKIEAIDFDEWAYNNSLENVVKNNCKKISVQLGNANVIKAVEFDYILANINRNVLLNDMSVYATHLVEKGILLLSGFYTEDVEIIESAANENNLSLNYILVKNNWVAAKFIKN